LTVREPMAPAEREALLLRALELAGLAAGAKGHNEILPRDS